MKTNPVKILSVGGSIIIPESGFDILFLQKFKALIVERVTAGEKFILVIGGGSTARKYQEAGRALGWSDTNLDWLGIQTTILNAHFIKELFGSYAHGEVITDPTKKVVTDKPVIIAAGWKPGCSTDNDAVLLAQTYGAGELINVSNIDYVYTADPKKDPSATKKEKLTWDELTAIIGTTWVPGANVPFDPTAAGTAMSLGLTVKFVKGTSLSDLKNALENGTFSGSIIG